MSDSSFKKSSERIEFVQKLFNGKVKDERLYHQAFRHKSAVEDNKLPEKGSYERLEFLGDAVLDLIVSQIIFKKYQHKPEGFLTKLRAALVKGQQLAKFTNELGLVDYLIIGNRVDESNIKNSTSVLADVFEALIGAIYLDAGYSKAYQFVENTIEEHATLNNLITTLDNYKSLLLEYTQAVGLPIPRYKTIKETGPDHQKVFEIAVLIGSEEKGRGVGRSKKKAEQSAAQKALKHYRNQ